LSDVAGEVVIVGAGVTRFKKSDRVANTCTTHWIGGPPLEEYKLQNSIGFTADGMLAEHVVIHENDLVHLPDYLTYVEAASLPAPPSRRGPTSIA
jgi:NADPH:quinone reductase-like Zn-dependent oxidoreductase